MRSLVPYKVYHPCLWMSNESWVSRSNLETLILVNCITCDYPPPSDIDRPLNETVTDKIRDYRADYNNRPSKAIFFMTVVSSTSDRAISTVTLSSFYF